MNEQGMDYPFAKTAALFGNPDIVFVNLEGPIPRRHVATVTGSTNFSFKKEIAQRCLILIWLHITKVYQILSNPL